MMRISSYDIPSYSKARCWRFYLSCNEIKIDFNNRNLKLMENSLLGHQRLVNAFNTSQDQQQTSF